ncbi:MAG: prolipoprotein diacylglyceryl transferase [Pontiellaceae bacterium]|nr:prolipoprotein diacylglyceryl transferase [Pontiellaceae bacterium]MBN2783511.1 prolipoprotein diacylglyceryl transferase [Pontiellaceae bacterium]
MMELTHQAPDGWGFCPDGFPAYPLFMLLAIAAGAGLFMIEIRKRDQPSGPLFPIALAALIGGVIGAKLPILLLNLRHGVSWETLLAGRTIVGGLVGGTLAVLFIKKRLGIQGRYGNRLAAPIALGMAIGRIGCLLSGCCFGKPTNLPWGIDFGDGIARHPTQLYEMLFCFGALTILLLRRKTAAPGSLLTGYFMAYFVFRFLEEFLRTHPIQAGLTTFQWICIAGMLTLLAKNKLMQSKEKTDE